MSDYEYDVFLSYPRKSLAAPWLSRWFLSELTGWLNESMGREPRLFVDSRDIAPGTAWPDELARALCASRCLLAILTPPYFRSAWCMAEWQSFLDREHGLTPGAEPLVVPIAFWDGEHFDEEARRRQALDFRPHSNLTRRTQAFIRDVQEIAKLLARRVDSAPPWREFPIVRPSPEILTNPPMSRLA